MLFSSRDLRRLVLPLIGEQMLAVCVGMADTVMVAACGEASMSGVALVDSIAFLLLQLFAALCTGGAVVVSQYLGKGDSKEAGHVSGQLLSMTFTVSLALCAFALVFKDALLYGIFGSIDAPVMQAAQIYFGITALSFPFLGIYNAGFALLRSVGNTAASLKISIVMNIVNVAGNAWLIYGMDMGVAGAAISTLASRILAAVAILVLLLRTTAPFSLRGQLIAKPDLKAIGKILRIGVPSAFENCVFQIGKLLVQRLVTSFGTVAIAAISAAGTIACIATIPGSAVSLALLSVVGRCMGAERPGEAVKATKRLVSSAYLAMLGLNLLVFIFLNPIVSIYNLTAPTAALTTELMQWHCLFAALVYVPSFCLPSALRGAGDVSYTMKVSIISMWIFRIGGSYLFANALGFGAVGVWLAVFADWIIRALLFTLRFARGKWKKIKVINT